MADANKPDELLPTRASLLKRLKNLEDNQSWQEFFDTYSGFIHHIAMKSGLTDAEAKDVVQETFIAVAKNIGAFEYDPRGSFKAWLLKGTHWRIAEQFRRRLPVSQGSSEGMKDTRRTRTFERFPTSTAHGWDAKWEVDWRNYIQNAAIQRIRRTVNPKHYQIFDTYVIKCWPVEKVMKTLRVSEAQVYKAKERIVKSLQAEVLRLEKKGI
jgi:RNA polymerase sigma-70 factor (ECF subfamily)